jgi:hypothetical protein
MVGTSVGFAVFSIKEFAALCKYALFCDSYPFTANFFTKKPREPRLQTVDKVGFCHREPVTDVCIFAEGKKRCGDP